MNKSIPFTIEFQKIDALTIRNFTFHPSSRLMAVAYSDCSIHFWNLVDISGSKYLGGREALTYA